MGTRTIRVSDDVYERLDARKRDDESFTDLLERLVETRRDVRAGFGEWSDVADAMEDVHEDLKDELEEGLREFEEG